MCSGQKRQRLSRRVWKQRRPVVTQDQFIDFLRSGGTLGNAHLYSTNRLSDAGGKNLYLYVLSLGTGGGN
jgi:hypothetical protein